MDIFLARHSHNQFGTFGTLTIGGFSFQTVEQDWEDNLPNISCIPNGMYTIEPYDSPQHGKCIIIYNPALNVGKFKGEARRFGCLIHAANIASQLRGCIAPGMTNSMYQGHWSVKSSRTALGLILDLLGNRAHTLVIESKFPTFIEA